MSIPFSKGQWLHNPYDDWRDICQRTGPNSCHVIATVGYSLDGQGDDTDRANARLIAAAPDYAVACGLHLHPGENETCGPLSWLRTAIDTLKEDAVRHAASAADSAAYWHMVNELEGLLTGLVNASAKARGENTPGSEEMK